MRVVSLCASLAFAFSAVPFSNALEPAFSVLDDCSILSGRWSFHDGGEFPGAKGSLKKGDGGLAFSYDFSKGGEYVSASRALPPSQKPLFLRLSVESQEDCHASFRVVDAVGRTFQGDETRIAKGSATLQVDLCGKWKDSWGGPSKASVPELPLSSFSLCAGKEKGLSQEGALLLKKVELAGEGLSFERFKGEDVSFEASGWDLKASWSGPRDALFLSVKAQPLKGSSDAILSASLPMEGRAQTKRLLLKAGEPQEFVFEPKLVDGGNPANVYSIKLSLSSQSGERSAFARLYGDESAGVNLGAPKSSLQIKDLPFGTCAHFSYGEKASGAFGGWHDWKRLVDIASDCGYKWLRDGASIKKGDDGKPHLKERDLEWIRYAKSKGIETILVLEGFVADRPLDELAEQCVAAALETKGLVNVFELGNEPNNFGNWRKKYGPAPGKEGMWNGCEADGTTSQWVKEHLRYTNAVAEAMKKARPDATLIGIGACAPTNFRYLDLGVSPALDGIVEHPYTFSMPPERVPFGWDLEKRDGVRVGDKESSFQGLVESYFEKFKQTGQSRSLWVTEFGFTTFRFDGKNEKGLYAGFSEEAQAAYLVRRFVQSLSLPVAVSCQYDLIDDYNSTPNTDEANFGILRSDFSPKPAYFAIQRMNSLFDGFKSDASASVSVDKSPLHRSLVRAELVKDWDGVSIKSPNGVLALAFSNKDLPEERILAVWSAQPYSKEFNNRVASISVRGWDSLRPSPAIGINLLTGETFDVPFKIEGGSLSLEGMSLGSDPIAIKFLRAVK